MTLYNDNDPFVANWLECLMDEALIPAGRVESRSVIDVPPTGMNRHEQAHFFAGKWGAWRTPESPDRPPLRCENCDSEGRNGAEVVGGELYWFGDGRGQWSDSWYCTDCMTDGFQAPTKHKWERVE